MVERGDSFGGGLECSMDISLRWALNLLVVSLKAKNISWWDCETDLDWWAVRLWTRRN